jgi:hypothetical protein
MPNTGSIQFVLKDWETPVYVTLTGTIPPANGHYHNCKFTYDGITLKYYLNDVLNASTLMSNVRNKNLSINDIILFARIDEFGNQTDKLGQGGDVYVQNLKIYDHATID